MTQNNVRTTLRLGAVLTILVGAILVTIDIFSLIAISTTVIGPGVQISSSLGFWIVMAHGSVAGWGLVLFRMSDGIAKRVLE